MLVATQRLAPFLLFPLILIGACSDGDVNRPAEADASSPIDAEPTIPPTSGGAAGSPDGAGFVLRTASDEVTLVEGGAAAVIDVRVNREAGFDGPVTLAAETPANGDARELDWSFSDERLTDGESVSRLQVTLGIGARPLLPERRTLRISATDGSGVPAVTDLTLQIEPTAAPDIYLLIGQSNMVGFSEPDSRQAQQGEPDAPDPRIRQLNPTGNDEGNFKSDADFTDQSVVADPMLSIALDPLHDGFNTNIDSKRSEFIGSGLSFAKAALADTTADILLVPGAWSDTGFCARDSNLLPGVGWLPRSSSDPVFAGTLLHDRAIARTNLAIEQSGGVLRGILWHQGEADASVGACAAAYTQNLTAMVASLRSRIRIDARGPAARGPQADIPFVVGTMSKGTDSRGSQLPFTPDKERVDAAHRSVADTIPLSGFVNNDDLVPPAYPCGESSCVHFGARALREMGVRYHAVLSQLLDRP